MALFPEGHQVIPLFVSATVVISGFGLLAIVYATTTLSIMLTSVFADPRDLSDDQPSKASYSMAPTMVVARYRFSDGPLFVKTPQGRSAL